MIIVVDDDKAVRDAISFSLRLEGMDVRVYDSAQSLFGYPGFSHADCFVIDHRMPEIDGFALGDMLTAQGLTAPRIMITAPVNAQLRKRASASGFFAILEKPLLGDLLPRTIRAALAH